MFDYRLGCIQSGLSRTYRTTRCHGSTTLDKNWDNLASDDPTIALRSVSLLSRETDLAIDFFNQFVTRKTNIASAANIKQLIQQLGAPVYEERMDAFNKLQSLRSVSENMLREALNDKSLSSEIRLAVGELLQQTHKQPEIAKDEYRQLLRLVHILEMNGSDQAEQFWNCSNEVINILKSFKRLPEP